LGVQCAGKRHRLETEHEKLAAVLGGANTRVNWGADHLKLPGRGTGMRFFSLFGLHARVGVRAPGSFPSSSLLPLRISVPPPTLKSRRKLPTSDSQHLQRLRRGLSRESRGPLSRKNVVSGGSGFMETIEKPFRSLVDFFFAGFYRSQ
jgi:hypothetical protein